MKKSTLIVALTFACKTALGASAPDAVIDKLLACDSETDAQRRLSCFDREIAPLRARIPTVPAAGAPPPSVPAAAAPAVVAAPKQTTPSFGVEQLGFKAKPSETAESRDLHVRITGLQQVDASAALVTLDNGQIWRHENPLLGSYLKVGESVTIGKGALGSYRLTRDAGESRAWIRVTRVR